MFCVFPQATSPCPRGCFKRHPLLSHTRIGQHAQAHVLPLLPASLARSGSRSRPRCLLSLAKYRSVSRLLPKGEATSQARTPHAPPGSWQIPSLHWLSVSRARDVIGPCLRPEGGTRLGCTAQEEGGGPEEGHALRRRVFWFGFFFSAKEVCFGHASRLPPPPAPSSAPGRTPLGADRKAPFLARSAKFSRARGSPSWYRRSARLSLLRALSCKETAAWSPLAQTIGSSQDTRSCTFLQRGLSGPRRS